MLRVLQERADGTTPVYNGLPPNGYGKRQWNAMPTVRNSATMPFVSQNCAGEFTGL